MVSGIPSANRREARKLGLLRMQKIPKPNASEWSALERNERVCGECPTQMLILMKKMIYANH